MKKNGRHIKPVQNHPMRSIVCYFLSQKVLYLSYSGVFINKKEYCTPQLLEGIEIGRLLNIHLFNSLFLSSSTRLAQ